MLAVLLCAYNEEAAIEEVLKSFEELKKQGGLEIILVDDGSQDRTYERARPFEGRLPLRLIRHEKNWGLGLSLRQAIEIVLPRLHDSDVIATLDADGTHPASFILKLAGAIENPGTDLAIASRFAGAQGEAQERGMPWMRRQIARLARQFFAWRFPLIRRVADSTSGFRCYRTGALRRLVNEQGRLRLCQKNFAIQMEILLALSAWGAGVSELPFRLDYSLKRSQSGFRWAQSLKDYFFLLCHG